MGACGPVACEVRAVGVFGARALRSARAVCGGARDTGAWLVRDGLVGSVSDCLASGCMAAGGGTRTPGWRGVLACGVGALDVFFFFEVYGYWDEEDGGGEH